MLKVNAKTGEIFIYDTIGADWFGEGITANAVIDALDALGGKRATVRINSPGGVADEGIAIYNALKRYPGGVDTYNDALAASAASVIFLAGDNRYMSEGSRVMIHKALTIAVGNSTQMRSIASTLDSYDKSLVEIYSSVMDSTPEEILSLLEAETWYTTEEAIGAKLATDKTSATKEKPKVASWFKNAPSNLIETNESKRFHRIDMALAVAKKWKSLCR